MAVGSAAMQQLPALWSGWACMQQPCRPAASVPPAQQRTLAAGHLAK